MIEATLKMVPGYGSPVPLDTAAIMGTPGPPEMGGRRYAEVPGHPHYRVCTDGTLWTVRSRNGKGPDLAVWRLVIGHETTTDHKGRRYRLPRLYRRTGDGWAHTATGIHCIVLEAFVGPRPPGAEGAHEDGDPSNNRLDNLSWKTRKANQADRIRHGTDAVGERNGNAKLTAKQVASIRAEYASGATMRGLGRKYGVTRVMIRYIVRGMNWVGQRIEAEGRYPPGEEPVAVENPQQTKIPF